MENRLAPLTPASVKYLKTALNQIYYIPGTAFTGKNQFSSWNVVRQYVVCTVHYIHTYARMRSFMCFDV